MKKTASKIIYTALSLFFAALFLFSSYKLYGIFKEYKKGWDAYKESKEFVTLLPEEERTKKIKKEDEGKDEKEIEMQDGCPVSVDFEGLKKKNKDIIGWIYCEDTPINYPVLQGVTNDTYLRTLPDRTTATAGSIFLDSACDPEYKDLLSILYGHNMHDGSMFAVLQKYKDQAFYEKHPVMWYLAPDMTVKLYVTAGLVVYPTDPVYGMFAETKDLDAFMERAGKNSVFVSRFSVSDPGHVFVLSTCDYTINGGDGRFLLVCVPVICQSPHPFLLNGWGLRMRCK